MSLEMEANYSVASRKRRILAFIIDHFVFTCCMVSIAFSCMRPASTEEPSMGKMSTTLLAIMIPGFLLYFAKDSIKGMSFGKWILGVMVRDAQHPHETPSFIRLFVRNLFVIIWPVELVVLATNKEKKRLGDTLMKTVVLNNPHKASKWVRILVLFVIAITFFTTTFLFSANMMKNSEAYKVAVMEIEQNEEILEETGGIKGYGFLPTGNIQISNGVGVAQLQITVIGNKKEMKLDASLTKEPGGKWKLIDLKK